MIRSAFFVVIFVINAIYAETDCAITHADLNKCCALPVLVVNDKCHHYFKDVESIEDRSCYIACIVNESHAMENSEPNIETFKAFIGKSMESGSDFLNLYINSVDSCVPFATEKAKVEDAAAQRQCSHYPRILLDCIVSNSFFYCPDNKWTKSVDCDALRKKVKSCYNIR